MCLFLWSFCQYFSIRYSQFQQSCLVWGGGGGVKWKLILFFFHLTFLWGFVFLYNSEKLLQCGLVASWTICERERECVCAFFCLFVCLCAPNSRISCNFEFLHCLCTHSMALAKLRESFPQRLALIWGRIVLFSVGFFLVRFLVIGSKIWLIHLIKLACFPSAVYVQSIRQWFICVSKTKIMPTKTLFDFPLCKTQQNQEEEEEAENNSIFDVYVSVRVQPPMFSLLENR